MSREDQHFRLRLPADLREKVEAAAAESRRSLTAEILARLETSFQANESHKIAELEQYILELKEDLAEQRKEEALNLQAVLDKFGPMWDYEDNPPRHYMQKIESKMEDIFSKIDSLAIEMRAQGAGSHASEASPTTPSTPTPKRPSRAR